MDKAMKDALIERAARAICKRNDENWSRITVAQCDAYRADATAALEATGVFDLVEAAEALKVDLIERANCDYHYIKRKEKDPSAVAYVAAGDGVWSRFIAALNRMKGQDNDPA